MTSYCNTLRGNANEPLNTALCHMFITNLCTILMAGTAGWLESTILYYTVRYTSGPATSSRCRLLGTTRRLRLYYYAKMIFKCFGVQGFLFPKVLYGGQDMYA